MTGIGKRADSDLGLFLKLPIPVWVIIVFEFINIMKTIDYNSPLTSPKYAEHTTSHTQPRRRIVESVSTNNIVAPSTSKSIENMW